MQCYPLVECDEDDDGEASYRIPPNVPCQQRGAVTAMFGCDVARKGH